MSLETVTVDAAVTKAAEDLAKDVKSDTKIETKVEETLTEEKEEKEEEKLTKEEIAEAENAKQLYNTLKDPEKGIELVRFLAKQAGLLVEDGKSVRSAVRTTTDIVREKLGTDYEFLADKLAPAIEEVVKTLVGQEVQSVKNQLAITQKEQAEVTFNSAWKTVNDESEGLLDEHAEAIDKLVDNYPYSGKQPLKEYLNDLLALATRGTEDGRKIAKTIDKITKNSKGVNLTPAGASIETVKTGSKLPTLDEAINAALAGKRLE